MNKFNIDLDKRKNGVWKELEGYGSFLIASPNELEMMKATEKVVEQYRLDNKIDPDTDLKGSQAKECFYLTICDCVLLDWDLDHEFNKENAMSVVVNYPDIRNFVAQTSANLSIYEKEEKEKQVKKS